MFHAIEHLKKSWLTKQEAKINIKRWTGSLSTSYNDSSSSSSLLSRATSFYTRKTFIALTNFTSALTMSLITYFSGHIIPQLIMHIN
jgi:hypothetical protein